MDKDAIKPKGRLIPSELSDSQKALLARVEDAVKNSGTMSYELAIDEQDDAYALVRLSLLFYSLDHSRVCAYRRAHE